jgi:hypothetical protein
MCRRFTPTARTWRCNYTHTKRGTSLTFQVLVWTIQRTWRRTGCVLRSTNCQLLLLEKCRPYRQRDTARVLTLQNAHTTTSTHAPATWRCTFWRSLKTLQFCGSAAPLTEKGGVWRQQRTHRCLHCYGTQLHYGKMCRLEPAEDQSQWGVHCLQVHFLCSAAQPPDFSGFTATVILYIIILVFWSMTWSTLPYRYQRLHLQSTSCL